MKLRGTLFALTLAVAICFVASPARADQVDLVTMNFFSGATFTGTVTFASDLSVIGVLGTLTGYQYPTPGPTTGGSDAINWVFNPGTNYANDPSINFGTYLMDGPPGIYDTTLNNAIYFVYDYTSGFPVFTSTDLNGPSGVLYVVDPLVGNILDPMTSGTIVPTPEPCSLLLLGAGLASLLGAARNKRLGQVTH